MIFKDLVPSDNDKDLEYIDDYNTCFYIGNRYMFFNDIYVPTDIHKIKSELLNKP